MAHHSLPHFEHHRREILRAKRRFSGTLLALLVGLSIVLGLQFHTTRASSLMVSGRIYNATTSVGLANVQLDLCANQTAVTNGAGDWSAALAAPGFCVRYVSGAPAGLIGPVAINNNPEIGPTATYEHQAAGASCYHNISCTPAYLQTYDRNADTGYDLSFTSPPIPVPMSVPVPKPTPEPAATPTPAPTPASPTTTPAAIIPNPPTGFQALTAGDNALVTLSWTLSTDTDGVKSYRLERSLDQLSWTTLADNLPATTYQDNGVGFNLHYFYRLRAIDSVGNLSDPATADATTPSFANNATTASTTYTSDDSLATALVPAGALATAANCSVASDKHKVTPKAKAVIIAGPYALVCKTANGELISGLSQPVTWSYNLAPKLKGYTGPTAVAVDTAGQTHSLATASFNPQSHILQFNSAQAGPTAILAAAQVGLPIDLTVIVIAIVIVVVLVALLVLRTSQKRSYNDYLRSKYYNL